MKTRSAVVAILAFIGMVDALYLSIKRNAGPIPCHVTRGCTDVLTSKYSEIAGIPISWFGVGFYIVMFSLVAFKIFEDPKHPSDWLEHPAVWGMFRPFGGNVPQKGRNIPPKRRASQPPEPGLALRYRVARLPIPWRSTSIRPSP